MHSTPEKVQSPIQEQIDRIITAVGAAYDAVEQKGGTVPQSETVAGLAEAIGSIPVAKNPHSTTWDFAQRDGIKATSEGGYPFDSTSDYPFQQYLATDDTRWINGTLRFSDTRIIVFANEGWFPSVTDITETGFSLNAVRTGSGILVPYFMRQGQTIAFEYAHSIANEGGYIWCDRHGKFVTYEPIIDYTGAGVSSRTFVAPTDGWLYVIFGTPDANVVCQYSNISVVIE